MAILKIGSLIFEWDDAKSVSNLSKHGVSFLEAVTVFHDGLGLLRRDTVHSTGEDRFLLIGISTERNILVVVHVERGERIRIISARRATPRERRTYEQGSLGR
ncbi:MAG: BrnT family toxin [Edaphobacter sp.]